MTQRSTTPLGSLGRAPARASTPLPVTPDPPPPERGAVRRGLRSALLDNMGLKFLSMVLAVTVFLLVNTDKDREITARVGVSYILPVDKVLMTDRLDEVRVTIKGAWRRLRKFDEREIDRISLDLRNATNGEIAITTEMIQLPSGVSVTSINPRSVHVAFDKRVDKVVEVNPIVIGRPQHGYVVAEIKPTPATVKLRGAESTLAALTQVRTRDVSLEARAETFTGEAQVMTPDGVDVVGNAQVEILVHIEEELVARKLPPATVMIRGDGDVSRWRVTPAQVDLSVTGALITIEKARDSIVPVVKLPADGRPREVEVTVEGLPPGIGVKISPEHVRLAPLKPAAPVAPPRGP
jgi:YbbR domain-containing protein